MFYLLLVLPHVAALAGLFAFAYYSNTSSETDTDDGWNGGGPPTPPDAPRSGPPPGDLPLPESSRPRRRLRDGQKLSELHPPRPRREHGPREPQRAPAGS